MPQITITMLGGPASGKTMYLHGLYAAMSAGLDGYTLHADDLDQDIALTSAWGALLDKGELPEPNIDSTRYRLVFRQGFTRLVDIDWLDYRGGAMTGLDQREQTDELVAQLARSDSIYLTLDGRVLAAGSSNSLSLQHRTSAGLMSGYLLKAAEARGGPPPSIVVLLTKADLLVAGAASADEALAESVSLVRNLLPAAFQEGTTTMVCPVSLGALGEPDDNVVDAEAVSPRWVQKPIVFSLVRFFQEERAQTVQAMADARGAAGAEESRLTELRESLFGRFRQGRRRELAARVSAARAEFDGHRTHLDFATERDRRLQDQLDGPRYFRGDVEMDDIRG